MAAKRPEKSRSSRSVLPVLSLDSSANVQEVFGIRRDLPRGLLSPGTLFGRRYRIGERIGSGGMGVVYSANEVATNDEVAIKVLSASAASPANVRRFRREGQTAASVVHRRCCRVLGVGVDRGAAYIVMDRLEGETLRRRLNDSGPLSAADAVAVMMQLLEGLSAAHAVGVLHRDIKPGNIFLTTPRGVAPSIKIIDFGLAKLLPPTAWSAREEAPDEEQSAITTTDVVPGTPMYLAPEQINGERDLDERVDIWAAGLTFYEMLLNRRAFGGESYVALAHDIVLRALPSLSGQRPDLPVGFDALLARALAKHRERRFATATDFRDALLSEWAKFRTAGVARAAQMRNFRRPAQTLPTVAEPDLEEPTEINVRVDFEPDG